MTVEKRSNQDALTLAQNNEAYLELLHHDLFGAVANIEFCLEELLEDSELTTAQRSLVWSIAYSQKALTMRGKNILDHQKLVQKIGISIQPMVFNLKDMIRNVIQLIDLDARDRGIAWSVEFPDGELMARADIARLERMIWNVCVFLLRHSGPTNWLTFSLVVEDKNAILQWIGDCQTVSEIQTEVEFVDDLSIGEQIDMHIVKLIVNQHNGVFLPQISPKLTIRTELPILL